MSVLARGSSEPITARDQLIAYFASAEKPPAQWRIGVEHEKFAYRLDDLRPAGYDEAGGLRDFLKAMLVYGWQPVMEGDHLIGLLRDEATISFEPGGQIELSGAPLPDLHATQAELQQHLTEVNAVGSELGLGFLGIGFHPTAARGDIPWVPKERYRIMRDYMATRGSLGHDMMLRSCTVQVNLDFASEAAMVAQYRLSLALQPLATALFATSPFREKRPSGFNSTRMTVWTDTDPDRCGAPDFVYEDGFGYERYTDYALNVPMYFVYRDGAYIDCAGQSFRDFLRGDLPALPGVLPTLTDWANHLTTLFPDVRLKKILEMRGADAGPAELLQALPAFWTGLLYDAQACDAAAQIVKPWTAADRAQLKADVPRLGLKAQIAGRSLLEVARDIVELSRQGLQRRKSFKDGKDESRYLDPLRAIAASGENRSDQLLAKALRSTNNTMLKIIEASRL